MTEPNDVLTINGVDYFAKQVVDKMVADASASRVEKPELPEHESLKADKLEPWSYKESQKIVKTLTKFLSREPTTDFISSDWALNVNNLLLMDAANVSLVKAKSKRARLILRQWFGSYKSYAELAEIKCPQLTYDEKHLGSSRFSIEYFKLAIELIGYGFDSFTASVGKDYPTTLQTDDWEIIIAPRVEHN